MSVRPVRPAPPPPAVPPGGEPRPLVLTDDPRLLDEVLRAATAAGVEPFVAGSPEAAVPHWATASLVLVGAEHCAALARARLPRRPAVVVVSLDGAVPDAVFARAVEVGAERVALLPDAEGWLADAFADATVQPVPGSLVAVFGGRGGAGATALAAALAVTAHRRGLRTMLVDGDQLGGGIDLVLGAESVAGLRWSQLSGTRGQVGPAALQEALPSVGELTVLSFDHAAPGPVPGDAMSALLHGALRGHDLVVVDLPRRLDEAACVALRSATVGLLVVPAEVRAAAAASRVLRAAAPHCRDVRLVVRGPAPSGLAAADVAAALALPLAGALRAEPGLAGDLERGEPPAARGRGPLAAFCRSFLDVLGAPGPLAGRVA